MQVEPHYHGPNSVQEPPKDKSHHISITWHVIALGIILLWAVLVMFMAVLS
jgi:hypothetical protein